MTVNKDKLEVLETLVDELCKNNPREEIVATYMSKAGLADDSKNAIDRINQVLRALHFEEKEKAITE